jgi:hypothetical protein
MGDRLALVDIDGVLADTRHRDEYAVRRDWGTYFYLMHLDGVWPQGVELLDNLELCGYDLAYLTGRREDTRAVTRRWLKKNGFPKLPLIMRREDDRAKLAHLKAGVVADAFLLYPDGVVLWDDDPWVVEEANRVRAGAGRRTTWYVKPESIVRRGTA